MPDAAPQPLRALPSGQPPDADHELVLAAGAGDSSAWPELIGRYS